MAVYKRTYRGYSGTLTNPAWRFLVLQRYAFRAIFRSRFLLIGYLACFIGPLAVMCMLYLNQNAAVLNLVHVKPGLITIDGKWFLNFLNFQGGLAIIATAFVGPSLIAPDLTNGALAVYLSRPFTRWEYILGKGSVLGTIVGSITLLPLLLCFLIQSSLAGFNWFWTNLYIAGGILVTSVLLIAILVLMGLAMSALVRWRIVAGALILAAFVAGSGFGLVIDNVMRTTAGHYLDIQYLISTVGRSLFRSLEAEEPIPALGAGFALMLMCGFLLLLLNRKLRVCEVAG